MLETLFIWALVVLPLAVAVVLIAYRARFFVLGIAAIVLVVMLIWAVLRFAIVFDPEPDPVPHATGMGIGPAVAPGRQSDLSSMTASGPAWRAN